MRQYQPRNIIYIHSHDFRLKREAISAPKIPISYKINNGTAIKTCETTSGGVKIADTIKIINTQYFLFDLKESGFTSPISANNDNKTGT